MDNLINDVSKVDDVIVSSRVRLLRNISGYKFPKYLSREEGRCLFDFIEEVIKKYLDDTTTYKLWEYNIEYETYKEKNLIDNNIKKNKDISGIIVSKNETFTALINGNDHLRLQKVINGYNIDEAYKSMNLLDEKMEKDLEYSFDDSLGYITSKIENLGTGMRAAVMLHIPMLVLKDEIFSIAKKISRFGMNIKPIYGEKSNAYGNLYQIANDISLGMTEEDIIKNLKKSISIVVREEKIYRGKYLEKSRVDLEDKIYRSYGMLKNARLLSQIEVLKFLSDLRLGAELGFLDVDKSKLDKLTILSRSSIIRKELKKDLDFKELNYERARIVRESLNF